MNVRRGIPLALALLVSPCLAAPQDWDPIKQANGWASFDRDGSCVFRDAAGRRLLVWSRDTGVSAEVDLARLPGPPEKWALDPSGNAWVVCGPALVQVDKGGRIGANVSLPGEVADLAWDATSFFLCYKGTEPYVERRDMKKGALLWAYGTRPAKGASFPASRARLAVAEDGRVYYNSGLDFRLEALDAAKGGKLGTLDFTWKGAAAPALAPGTTDRGQLAWWLNNNTAFLGVPASQLPSSEFQGLVLAKLDLGTKVLTFLPSGLDERSVLVGLQDASAVLRGPEGGLTFLTLP